jgi:ligand-binding sensor domain-containing protein/class 3 adenylate cyclase/predicted metal-dependent HD superfamily phosphohydrolase
VKKVLVFLVASLFLFNSYAQQSSIKFGHLGLKEGLSQSDVLAIKQTKNGLLWFGTQDGLNSYNGFEFNVYSHDLLDSLSISNSFIHVILEENDTLLWIGTENGLNIFNTNLQSFTNIFSTTVFNNKKINVWTLVNDSNKTLWVGTDNALFKVNKETYKTEKVNLQLSTDAKQIQIRKLLLVKQHLLLIATEGNGLILYDTQTEESRQFYMGNSLLKSDVIWDLHEDSGGKIGIATNKGVNFFEVEKKRITSMKVLDDVIGSKVIKTIFEDRSGIIWIGTEGNGLYKLKSLSNVDLYVYDANQNTSLNSNKINTIYEDAFGIIWIGTQSGVNKFDKQKQYFKHHQHWPNKSNTINSNMVWSIFQDNNENLLVGTDKGLNVFNSISGHVKVVVPDFSFTKKKKNTGVYSIYKDHNGIIYIGTDGGVFSYENGEMIHISDSKNHQNEDRTYVIIEDNKNKLWLGTKQGVVVLDKDRKIVHTYTTEDGLPSDVIRSLYNDRGGNIWIGTDGGGLCKVIYSKGQINFEIYQNNQERLNTLSSNTVLSIHQGDDGFLWVGTFGGGLNKFNPKTKSFIHFTEKEGLSNNVIYGVLEDKLHNLWLSTNKGISSFNTKNNQVKNYDESDGLQSNEFNNGAYFKSKSGEMFFGGINGFNAFYPEDININTTKAIPFITQFYLFNKPVQIGENSILKGSISELDEIVLKYQQNVISFEFASLHYSYPLKNEHKYMLENFDEDWVYIGNNRRANYTNLDPGKYIFKVKVANSDGVWSDKVAQIRVIVEPPIWGTWWFRVLGIMTILTIIYVYYITRINRIKSQKQLLEVQVRERTHEVIKQKELLQIEKDKAEELLLNVLPAETAEELKTKGKATARQYRMTSIMFTDFKSFTKIAEKIKPVDLVTELDNYFKNFDEIIQKYDIEKIKTIGDAYMCAGGIPIRNKSNPIDIVLAGLEIQRFMVKYNSEKEKKGKKGWGLRIGIHTGGVIAGVVGIKRFAYDIWGDSVNIASRVESAGNIGKVNISGATYELVKEFFVCEYRGEIRAKNKGHIDMYFVHSIKPELSIDGEGLVPNELFQKYVDLHIYSGINYRKAEKYIVKRLEKELPHNLHYHDLRHTTDVCAAVERLALMEGIEGDDIFLLKTAALYHDAGFVHQYADNEDIGAALAQEVLPRFGYSQEQIETIGKLIQATKVPQKPNNHLEQIICDADLDYLGGDEFHFIADKLKRELMERNIINNDKQWDELQVKFLEAHTYFTKTAIELRRTNKLARVEELKEKLKNYE